MLPLRDSQPSKNYPLVSLILILINMIIFFNKTGRADIFTYKWGLIPLHYTDLYFSQEKNLALKAFNFISFLFVHGGYLHLFSNMWTLWIFGDKVEDRLGPLKFLIFYLACGFASGFVHILAHPASAFPVIGASGAVAGVMGAYFILYPDSKILSLIPVFFIPIFIEIRAFIYMGIWFFLQLFNAVGSQKNIAWWAHIGGFLIGILLLNLIVKLPENHFTDKIAKSGLKKKKSPGLQIIRPLASKDSPHMHGTLSLSSFEALSGCTKLVNIPWGFHSRLYKIRVPFNSIEGQSLRLKGLGRHMEDGSRGDLFLKIRIE